MKYSATSTITIVAEREITVALRNKSILITLSIITVLLIGGIGVLTWLDARDAAPTRLGVVGVDAEQFTTYMADSAASNSTGVEPVDATAVDSAATAREAILSGNLDAALIRSDSNFELLYEGTLPVELLAEVNARLEATEQATALSDLGINPEQLAQVMAQTQAVPVAVDSDTGETENMQAVLTVLVAISLMAFFFTLFAANIGGRVTEEKSSRVVEIILSTIRPIHLLAGKILANLIIGLIASLAIIAVGVTGLTVTGLGENINMDYSLLPVMIVAFILGMLLFGSLYAAAGALVSRTEDLQSTQAPIMFLLIAMTYVPVFGWPHLESTPLKVLAWVPPVNLTTAPIQWAAGNMELWQVFASFGVTLLVTVVVLRIVATI